LPARVRSSRGAGKPASPQDQIAGLTLDNYLHMAAAMRRTFKLEEPSFRLRDVESEAGTGGEVRAIVAETVKRHGSEIYAKQHDLIADLGTQVYGEWTQTPVYSGHRIRADSIETVLRRTIELGLQIVTQLPSQDQKPGRMPKLKPLATSLERLAAKVDAAFHHEEVQARMRILSEENVSQGEFLPTLSEVLRRGADAIGAMAKFKIKRVLSDSRNPQIRWATYFVQWITSSTGSQQYREITTLFDAAFVVARKRKPRWVGRLAIEMNLKRKRRKKSVRTFLND
jgi:hypothetical protein